MEGGSLLREERFSSLGDTAPRNDLHIDLYTLAGWVIC